MDNRKLSREVEKAARELKKARGEKSFWQYASLLGVGGWLFVLPILGAHTWVNTWTRSCTGELHGQ